MPAQTHFFVHERDAYDMLAFAALAASVVDDPEYPYAPILVKQFTLDSHRLETQEARCWSKWRKVKQPKSTH